MDDLIKEIEKLDIGKVDKNVEIAKHTTYKVGGEAKAFVYPKDVKSLVKLIRFLKANDIKYKVLGSGSNVLFSDKKYDGVIIKLSQFDDIEFLSNNRIRVGAGYSLIKLAYLTAKKSLTGLEFAAGIPGTVGGAVFMNAGAYKSDMGYVVQSVRVLTPELEIITLENKEMGFHYRTSYLQKHPDYICLDAILKLQKGKREAIEEVIKDRKMRRMASQPLEYPSAGSVFRNPEDADPAGKLIEDLGLKGKSIGGARVSEKHANFIINYNNATGKDLKELIELVHEQVKEKYNLDLKVEQEFVNWE